METRKKKVKTELKNQRSEQGNNPQKHFLQMEKIPAALLSAV